MKRGLVYNYNQYCGDIIEQEDGNYCFQYTPDYLASESSAISVTIPLSRDKIQKERLLGFFDGLIPEGWLLNIATYHFKIKSRDRMELLLSVCGDCIGSASIKRDNSLVNLSAVKEPESSNINKRKVGIVPVSRRSKRKILERKKIMKQVNLTGRCLVCGEKCAEQYHSLCAQQLFGLKATQIDHQLNIDLEDVEELAKTNLNQSLSVTGAQQKLSLSIMASVKEQKRLTFVTGEGLYILKPPPKEVPDFPANEHCIMMLAKALGLDVASHGLIVFSSGECGYITRRFDRSISPAGKISKRSMEDFGQIFNRNIDADKYKGSYEQVGTWLRENATIPGQQLIRYFEYVFFSYLIGNNDLHLKNLAILTEGGKVVFAPGFDLVSTQLIDTEPQKELTLPMQGKINNVNYKDWLAFGEYLKIPTKVSKRILNQYLLRYELMEKTIKRSFLPKKKQEQLLKFIKSKLSKIDFK